MNQPAPEPIDPEKLPELAAEVVRKDRFPYLACLLYTSDAADD